MFDQYLQPVPVGPRRRTTSVVVGASVAAHSAAIAAIVLIGMWRIDKLQLEDMPVAIPTGLQLPDRPAPGGGDGNMPKRTKKLRGDATAPRAKKTTVSNLQPTDEPPVEEDTRATGGEDGDEFTHELGDDNGPGGTGIYIGSGHCPMPVCGLETSIPEVKLPVDPPDDEEDKAVPSDVLNGYRIGGEEKIAPSDPVRVAMVQAGQDTLSATIRICVDRTGKVRDLHVLKSSGYGEYDRDLVRAMRAWRYRPYTIDGKAVPACTAIFFRFHMQ